MDVAVVATISAGIVTVAGIIANAYTAKQQRLQAIDLAEKAHSHERDLARGDRLYARRAPVYEEMITNVQAVMEHVEATEPIVSYSGAPLPPPVDINDQRALQAKLRTHGSEAVADALNEFLRKVRDFEILVGTLRTLRNQQIDITDVATEMNSERERTREARTSLERLVSTELESL